MFITHNKIAFPENLCVPLFNSTGVTSGVPLVKIELESERHMGNMDDKPESRVKTVYVRESKRYCTFVKDRVLTS